MKKRFLAMLLTLCMLISMLSTFSVTPIVFAAGTSEDGITVSPLSDGSKYAGEGWYMNGELDSFPNTIEVELKVSSDQASNNGVILGNYAYDAGQPYFIFRVLAAGTLKVQYRDSVSTSEKSLVFDQVDVRADSFVNVALVWDELTGYVHCYIDGVLKQSLRSLHKLDCSMFDMPLAVGSDRRTMAESCFFKGEIRKLALYSDARSATEVAADAATATVDATDTNLLAAYNTTGDKQGKNIEDLSNNNIDLMYQKYQMTEAEKVALCGETGDYDYSIAIVGDMHDYSSARSSIGWLANNAASKNIKYVIQTGDVTDNDTPEEW